MTNMSAKTAAACLLLCLVQICSANTQRMIFNKQFGMISQGKVENSHVFDYRYEDDISGFVFQNDYFFGDEFVGSMAINDRYRALGVPEHRQVYVLDHSFEINFFFVSDNGRDLEIYWNDGFSYSFPFYCVTQFADSVVLYNNTLVLACNNHTSGIIAISFDLSNPVIGGVVIFRAPLQRVTTRFSSLLVNNENLLLSVVNSFATTSQYYLWNLDTHQTYAFGIIDFRATAAAIWQNWLVFSSSTESLVEVFYCDRTITPTTCVSVITFQPKDEAQFGRVLSFHEGMMFIGGETYSYLMMVPQDGSLDTPYLVPFWSYFPDFLGMRKNMIASVISRTQLVAKYENDISTAVYYFQSCPRGKFWDHTMPLVDNTRCRLCPPGKYKDFDGFGLCNICPRGTYSSIGSLACTPDSRCPAGSPAPCDNLDIETRLNLFPRINTSLPRESAEVEFFGYSLPLLWIHVTFAILVLAGEHLVLWFSHSFFMIELVHVIQSTWNLSHHADSGGHDSHGAHGHGAGAGHKQKGGHCLFLLGHIFSVIMFVFIIFIIAYVIILSHEEIVSTEVIPSIKTAEPEDQVLYLTVMFVGYQGVCDHTVWDLTAVGINKDLLVPEIALSGANTCMISFTFSDGLLPRPRNLISINFRSQSNVFPFWAQAITITAETYNRTDSERIRSELITNTLPPNGIFNGVTSVFLVSHRRNILNCRKLIEFSFLPEPEYHCERQTQTYYTVENTVAGSTSETQFFTSTFSLVFRFGNAEFDINTKKTTINFIELLFVAVLVNLGVYHLLHGVLSMIETFVDIINKIIALRRQKKEHDIPTDPSAELNYHLMKEFEDTAAANFGQEVALMEALYEGLHPGGQKIRPTVISGASAGAIAAVGLSAIMHSENGGPWFNWDDFHALLWSIREETIIDTSTVGLARIITTNIADGYFLDPTPLRALLTQFTRKLNLYRFGDVYVPTFISVVDADSGETIRLFSQDPVHKDLRIVDVLMASAAITAIFPQIYLDGIGRTCVDGATGHDMIPLYALLDHGVDEVYILARERHVGTGRGLPPLLAKFKAIKNIYSMFEIMRQSLFWSAIEHAISSPVPCYAYIPILNTTYSAFDFDSEKQQWDDTMNWARNNSPYVLNATFYEAAVKRAEAVKKIKL